MAKAKKSESNRGSSSSKPAAAARGGAKKSTAAPAGSPLIDTNNAAQAAARSLVAGLKKPTGPATNAPVTESSMFKQLKAGLNKPHSVTMSNMLEKSQGPEPTKSHAAFNKQVGRNQTFGADVTRSGVPRRTPG